MRKDTLSVGRGGSAVWVDVQVVTTHEGVARALPAAPRRERSVLHPGPQRVGHLGQRRSRCRPRSRARTACFSPAPERPLPSPARIELADALVGRLRSAQGLRTEVTVTVVTWLYWLHFVFLAALVASVGGADRRWRGCTTVTEVTRTASGELLRGAACTDPGRVRTNNEDLPLIDAARGIFGVIDGVGGEAGGEVAAATAHDVILQRLARPLGTPADRVREAIAIANNEIFRRAQETAALHGMACVITLAIVADGRVTVGHVGDTRLYKIRHDGIRKLTRDHSPVGEREDAGELGEVDAMRHPRRNEVFRDVGSTYRDKDEQEFVDVIEEPLERDSAILVCSDGLSDMLTAVRDRAHRPAACRGSGAGGRSAGGGGE